MKIKKLLILGIIFVVLGKSEFQYPISWDELQSDDNWELLKDNKRVKIYNKDIGVSPLPAFKVELISDVDVDVLVKTAWLVEKSSEIFPNAYIVDAGIYDTKNDTNYVAFQLIDIPILSARLYQFNSILIGNSIHWQKIDTVSQFISNDIIIPPVNFGSWEVQEYGNQSKLIYRVYTDPGGDIPNWIIEKANQYYLPLMLIDLENFAKKNIY